MCACTESFSEGIIDRTGAQTMLYLTRTAITSVDLAYYGVSSAKDWISVEYGKDWVSVEYDICLYTSHCKQSHLLLTKIYPYRGEKRLGGKLTGTDRIPFNP